MDHDPLCPKTLHDYEHDDYTYYCDDRDKCETEYPCQCDLIVKVRAEERWATVESAVYVASQHGAVPELVQLLSRLYEAPEVQMDDEVRREAARELTQLAQEMGMIP